MGIHFFLRPSLPNTEHRAPNTQHREFKIQNPKSKIQNPSSFPNSSSTASTSPLGPPQNRTTKKSPSIARVTAERWDSRTKPKISSPPFPVSSSQTSSSKSSAA